MDLHHRHDRVPSHQPCRSLERCWRVLRWLHERFSEAHQKWHCLCSEQKCGPLLEKSLKRFESKSPKRLYGTTTLSWGQQSLRKGIPRISLGRIQLRGTPLSSRGAGRQLAPQRSHQQRIKSPAGSPSFIQLEKIEACKNFFNMKRKLQRIKNSNYKREKNI